MLSLSLKEVWRNIETSFCQQTFFNVSKQKFFRSLGQAWLVHIKDISFFSLKNYYILRDKIGWNRNSIKKNFVCYRRKVLEALLLHKMNRKLKNQENQNLETFKERLRISRNWLLINQLAWKRMAKLFRVLVPYFNLILYLLLWKW